MSSRTPCSTNWRASFRQRVDRSTSHGATHQGNAAERARSVASFGNLHVRGVWCAGHDAVVAGLFEPDGLTHADPLECRLLVVGQQFKPIALNRRCRESGRLREVLSPSSSGYRCDRHPAITSDWQVPSCLYCAMSRIVSIDSCLADSMKPQVLTTMISAHEEVVAETQALTSR